MARADGDGPWQFLGVLPLSDPPREDARSTIATARQLGVAVKMITGDQVAIAQETARTLGMGTGILDAASLGDAKREESAAAAQAIENADGFAHVFPEHKYHIVDVLQKRGHIVGMTGDGVNDASALKKADCGIAVSGATDAARAAASIVLMKPGLSVIIDAVKESRRIVQRMNSYAIYRIAETLRVLLFVTLAILIFNFFPVTAIMIVILALLNDGSILSIAHDRVHYKNQPEAWNMRLVIGMATVLGAVGPVAAFGLFWIGDEVIRLGHPQLQTLMYLMLSAAGSMTIYLTRTRGPFWSIRPARILVLAVTGAELIATAPALSGILVPRLGWNWVLLVWGYAITASRHGCMPMAARPPGGSCSTWVTKPCSRALTEWPTVRPASSRTRDGVIVCGSTANSPITCSRISSVSSSRNCGMSCGWPPITNGRGSVRMIGPSAAAVSR